MPRLMLNSRWVELPVAADTSLLDFLRQDRGLTAAKPACGSGDCSAVDWTFLGLTIANWSFLNFLLVAALGIGLLLKQR